MKRLKDLDLKDLDEKKRFRFYKKIMKYFKKISTSTKEKQNALAV